MSIETAQTKLYEAVKDYLTVAYPRERVTGKLTLYLHEGGIRDAAIEKKLDISVNSCRKLR